MSLRSSPAVGETRDGNWVQFAVEVKVPIRQAPIFAEALTGNDDDIILAAETAMRERIEEAVSEDAEKARGRDVRYSYDLDERLELAVVEEAAVKPFLAEAMGPV